MNIFTIDMASKSKTLNSNSILRLYIRNMILKFIESKTNEPKLTQKEISNQLRFSHNTIKRYRNDIQKDSLLIGRNKERKILKKLHQ